MTITVCDRCSIENEIKTPQMFVFLENNFNKIFFINKTSLSQKNHTKALMIKIILKSQ